MLNEKKAAFDTISRVLAITRLDIEQHQAINDQSLNIHGEDYFKDVFNFVYDSKFVNANISRSNEPFIDLIDKSQKRLIQITTTRTREKIENSLKALLNPIYKGYKIEIYYLLDKAMPNSKTVKEIEKEFPVKLKKILRDSNDLIVDINSLETEKIIELSAKYFAPKQSKYTDNIVLNLVFKKLIKEHRTVHVSYDDDFGSIETNKKIEVNNINERIANKISTSLDYTCLIDNMGSGELSTELRELIVNDLYRNVLVDQLKSKKAKTALNTMKVVELQKIAVEEKINFNKILNQLRRKIEGLVTICDFNTMDISWILVSYFFEICDVGRLESDTAI